jgi:putative SOS response-associated peptidase YedK
LRWGLVAAWSDGVMNGASLFNARAESIADKPAFREAVRARRCLLPADGWYEWAHLPDGRRVPHFLSASDGAVVALAAVWEEWRDADGRPLRSTAVVTTAARDDLRFVHDRSPAVLPPEVWERWLDPRTPLPEALAMLTTTAVAVRAWPVSAAVGDVRAAGPELAAPVTLDEQPTLF